MMFPLREEALITNSKIGSPSTATWFYLSAEFLIGALITGFLAILGILKSFLPKPPRDLTGDVVLIAGASSSLGESLSEEFARNGCTVICVDDDLRSVEKIASRLTSCYPRVQEVRPRHRKEDSAYPKSPMMAYQCDFRDRQDIRRTAKKIQEEVGIIDVLVTCVGKPGQDIFDTASGTLMSHYWTTLAFLSSLLHSERGHIVGITPVTSSQDGYLGSRAAIAGLMESLGQLGDQSGHLKFLALSPTTEPNRTKESEEQIAKDVTQAIRRDQTSLYMNWSSRVLYQIGCVIYNAITTVSQWIQTQGCDYSF